MMLSWLLLPQPGVSSCSVQSPSGGRAGVFLRQMNGAASSIIPDSSPSLHTSIKLSHPYCEFGDSPKSHFIAFVQKYIINLPFVGYLIKMDRDADAVKEEWKYLYLHSEGLQYLFSKQNKALLGLWQQNSISVFLSPDGNPGQSGSSPASGVLVSTSAMTRSSMLSPLWVQWETVVFLLALWRWSSSSWTEVSWKRVAFCSVLGHSQNSGCLNNSEGHSRNSEF